MMTPFSISSRDTDSVSDAEWGDTCRLDCGTTELDSWLLLLSSGMVFSCMADVADRCWVPSVVTDLYEASTTDPGLEGARRCDISWAAGTFTQRLRQIQVQDVKESKVGNNQKYVNKIAKVIYSYYYCQCCGTASCWCRSGSDFPFWCRSKSGSGIASYHNFLYMLKNQKFFD